MTVPKQRPARAEPIPFLTASLPTCNTTSAVYSHAHSVEVPSGRWHVQYAGFASGKGRVRAYIPKIGARVAESLIDASNGQTSFSLEGLFNLEEPARLEMQITSALGSRTLSVFTVHTPCLRLLKLKEDVSIDAGIDPKCDCDMVTLLRTGCECGGK